MSTTRDRTSCQIVPLPVEFFREEPTSKTGPVRPGSDNIVRVFLENAPVFRADGDFAVMPAEGRIDEVV